MHAAHQLQDGACAAPDAAYVPRGGKAVRQGAVQFAFDIGLHRSRLGRAGQDARHVALEEFEGSDGQRERRLGHAARKRHQLGRAAADVYQPAVGKRRVVQKRRVPQQCLVFLGDKVDVQPRALFYLLDCLLAVGHVAQAGRGERADCVDAEFFAQALQVGDRLAGLVDALRAEASVHAHVVGQPGHALLREQTRHMFAVQLVADEPYRVRSYVDEGYMPHAKPPPRHSSPSYMLTA